MAVACFTRLKQFFSDLAAAYTARFLVVLFVINFFSKGILYIIATSSMLPMFKNHGASASELQMLMAIAMSPWSMKPLFGVLSDIVAIGKYHKRYWMILGSAIGIFGAFALIIQIKVIPVTVLFFLLLHAEMIVLDLLSEGKYAEIMRDSKGGSQIVAFVNASQGAGAIVSYAFVGPMADAALFQPLFLIALVAAAVPVVFISMGWVPELRRHANEPRMKRLLCNSSIVMADMAKAKEYGRILLVIVLTGLCSPVLSWLTAYVSQPVGLACSFAVLATCVTGAFWTCSPIVARIVLFQVLMSVGQVNIGSTMDYFYTAEETCLPGGPNFDYLYYMTYTGLVGALMQFAFMWMYQPLFGNWYFRRIVLLGTLLRAAAGIVDLTLIMRWTKVIGVSDKMFYIFGEAVVENIIVLIVWIPSNTIIGKVCPEGFETAIYAFIAGLSNMAGMVSNLTGAVVVEMVGIKTVLPHCNWDALPYTMVIGHVLIPTLVGLPAILLLPVARQMDSIEADGTVGTRVTTIVPPAGLMTELSANTDSELESININ